MRLRRAVIVAATYLVALLIAAGVPIAQLQTASEHPECCCPDPAKCKCPDHQPPGDTPSMRACHKNGPDVIDNQLASFVSPAIPQAIEPARTIHVVPEILTSPHPAPAPRRPDAPS